MKDDDFDTACRKMAEAAAARESKPIPRHDVYSLPPEDLVQPPEPEPQRTPPLLDQLLGSPWLKNSMFWIT